MSQDTELDLFRELHPKYMRLLKEFEDDENLVKGEFEKAGIIPVDTEDAGLKLTIPTTVPNAIYNAADHILSFPSVRVPVREMTNDREKNIQIAHKKQRFLEMWWDRVFVEQGDPLGAGKTQLVKGKLVVKKEIDWSLLPNPENVERFRDVLSKVSRSKFLWKLRLIPKETVFEDIENPHDPEFVFESYEITVHEARRRWPHMEGKLADRSPMERVPYLEYWSKPNGADRGKYIQWINEERAYEAFNPYSWESPLSTEDEKHYEGYVPYAIGDPGWGDVGPEAKPEDRYVSLIRPLRSVAVAECRFLTEMEAYLRLYIWKPLLTSGYPDDAEFKLGPGAHWERDPETQSIDLLQFGEMPISLLQGLERVKQQADEASKFGALGGTAQRGVDTATEAAQNVQNAASKLSGPVRTLRRMCTKINSWVLADVEKVLETPVTLYGATRVGDSEVTLSPQDISGFWLTSVEMETSDEAQLSLRVARVFSDLYQRIPISAEGVLEKAGYDDPRGEMDRRLIEDLERSPQSMQVFLLAMLSGLANTVSPAQKVQQAFQQNLAQLQGGAGNPGGNPQATGGDIPVNGIEQLREESRDQAISDQPELSYQ